MIAKVSAVIVGIGVLGTGSVALAKPGLLGMMPKYTTLKDKTNLSDKWVNSHKEHFVDSENNDDWFDWAFRTRYKEGDANNKSKFQNLTKGGKNNETGSLAGACKAAYEAATDKIKDKAADITDSNKADHFFEDNIWKYCSVKGGKPIQNGQ